MKLARVQRIGLVGPQHFGLELGLVVGRAGTDLTSSEAERCLFGVTLLNDLAARDWAGARATAHHG